MKLLTMAMLSVLCTLNQAITFSTIASVSLTLISLNKPVSCFFGIFRRRKSPVETVTPEVQSPFTFPNQPMSDVFNPFGFGAGGYFFPGFNRPGFGLFGPSNRFPPQPAPARPIKTQQPQRDVPVEMLQQKPIPPTPFPLQFQPQGVPVAPSGMDSFRDPREDVPGMNTEEAESFFTLLAETDESRCISRLVCEMGANPEAGGEFGQTVVEIIGSLSDFPDGSKVSEYNEVLSLGMAEGFSACLSKFSMCDEESYQLVKKAQVENE